jgi:hypothetical protein
MSGVSTTTSLYCRVRHGVAGRAQCQLAAAYAKQSYAADGYALLPPSGEVVGEISAVFDCEVRHIQRARERLSGYDCYDGGEHVDGHRRVRRTSARSGALSRQR